MNISQLSFLAKLITTNPSDAKAFVRVASIDILNSFANDKYSILLDGKTITAQSQKPLSEGARYWAQLTENKNSTPQLSHLLKQPQLLKNLQNSSIEYSIKDLQTILSSKNPQTVVKQNLLEHLSNSATKEEFINTSALLLSLENQTLTIPLSYQNNFSVLQFKKRYNKKTKKTIIDFYAALEFLGPISGILSLQEGDVTIKINVAFDKTKQFLENDMKNLSYNAEISVIETIEPLYSASTNSLLDISI